MKSQADAAAEVLQEAGRPMHRREITDAILRHGWNVWGGGAPGRTPWESVGRAITQEIVQLGNKSRFAYEHKGRGTYRLQRRSDGALEGSPAATCRTISVDLDDSSLALLAAECERRQLKPEELAARILARQLWEIDQQRAEDQGIQPSLETPPDNADAEAWESVRASAGPWEPRKS